MKMLLTILTVLSSFLTNLEQKTLQSKFTVTVAEEADAPMNYPGTITMKGRCFALSMEATDAAFDGNTMYMYSAETDELTLTRPTEEELLEANPFLFAKALMDVCTVSERTSANGKQTTITLTPKEQNTGVDRFTLKVRNEGLLPVEATVKEGKKVTTLRLMNPAFVTSEGRYTIEPEETTFVNDLRF